MMEEKKEVMEEGQEMVAEAEEIAQEEEWVIITPLFDIILWRGDVAWWWCT